MARAPPISISPLTPSSNPATIIFLHGFGDDAEGWTGLVQQFQAAQKLPHIHWLLPNAPHNHNAMTQAWFEPHAFSPIPMPVRSSDADNEGEDAEEEEEEEDEAGQRRSVEYIWSLVEKEVERGVKAERIVVGGFGQGAAISLMLGLGVKRKDKPERRVGGIVALSGYLPWSKSVREDVAAAKNEALKKDISKHELSNTESSTDEPSNPTPSNPRFFLAHGTRDQLVPMRIFRQTRERVEGLVGEERCRVKVYEGMPHSTAGAEIRDLCAWLEEVLPE